MHTDSELLSLLALGEQVGSENERLHAETCPVCAGELSELRRLVTLGRSVEAETPLVVPSDTVWARIRDELDLDVEPTVETPVHPRRTPLALIKAALAGGSHASDNGQTAHATLTPVETYWSAASGTAELATDERGRRVLQVALHADLPTSGVRQAWLIHRDDPTLRQTLGILDGPHGLWTVAQSLDLEKYAILDISQQGTGETEHSGQTIVRGELALVG